MATFKFADYVITEDEEKKLAELGLECPEDCAFAFTSFAEASAHGVGGAWVAMRRSARAMTSVAAAECRSNVGLHLQSKRGVSAPMWGDTPGVATPMWGATPTGAPSDQGFSANVVGKLCEGAPKARSQQRLGRGKKRRTGHPEHDLADRVAAASELLSVATWMEPAMKSATLSMLCGYEKKVLRQKMFDLKRWMAWCSQQGISAHDAAADKVQQFLQTKKRGTVATRFWDALRWAQKHLGAAIAMPSRPRRAAVKGILPATRQAVVLEPEMLRRLEQWIAKNQHDFTDKFVAAVGAWICTVSCLRFAHAQRARLVSRSASSVVLKIFRGKGRVDGGRPGFEVRLPRSGIERGSPADCLWELCKAQRWDTEQHGIIRSMATNDLMTLSAFVGLMRTVLLEAEMTTCPDAFTSYSLRRFLPTGADALHIPIDLRHAIGAWQGAVDVKSSKLRVSKCMPIRYSGCRGETEEQLKLFILEAVRLAGEVAEKGHLTWSAVRRHAPAWEDGHLQKKIANKMQMQVEWSTQATQDEKQLAKRSVFKIPVRREGGPPIPSNVLGDVVPVSERLPDPSNVLGEAAAPANRPSVGEAFPPMGVGGSPIPSKVLGEVTSVSERLPDSSDVLEVAASMHQLKNKEWRRIISGNLCGRDL